MNLCVGRRAPKPISGPSMEFTHTLRRWSALMLFQDVRRAVDEQEARGDQARGAFGAGVALLLDSHSHFEIALPEHLQAAARMLPSPSRSMDSVISHSRLMSGMMSSWTAAKSYQSEKGAMSAPRGLLYGPISKRLLSIHSSCCSKL